MQEPPLDQVTLPEELLSKVDPWWAKYVRTDKSLSKMALRLFRKGGSPITVGGYTKDVILFCRWLNLTPDKALASGYDWPALVNEYLDYFVVRRGGAKTSARTAVAAIKKWLETNDVLASRDLAWGKLDLPKNIRSESDQIPTKQNLRMALSGGTVKNRAMVTMAASSGLRRGSLLALRFKDVQLDREVPIIKPRAETTKGRANFFTFMTPEAKEALVLYKREREMRGEKVGRDSYVFTIDRPLGLPYKSGTQASANWIQILRRAGLAEKGNKVHKMHWHTLRKFYKSWASLSGMNGDMVEFTMGHRSSIAQVYFIADAENVPEDMVKKLEAEYRKAIPALTVMSDSEDISKLEAKLEETKLEYETKLRELREDRGTLDSALDDLQETRKALERNQKQIREMGLRLAELEAAKKQTRHQTLTFPGEKS